MSDLTKVGNSLLNMDDIAQYMWTVGVDFTGKTYPQGFNTSEDPGFLLRGEKSTDTKKVAGKPAEHIATAYQDSDGTVKDRTTVRNAILFNGHADTFFCTQVEKTLLEKIVDGINDNYLDEIKDLRDELYQLRGELAKGGTVQAYKPYAGFYDLFRKAAPLHLIDPVSKASQDGSTTSVKVPDADFEKFYVGDYLLLDDDVHVPCVVKINKLGTDKQTLFFEGKSASFNVPKKCKIYKSYGNVINETYTFGNLDIEAVDMETRKMSTVNDDTNFIVRPFPDSSTIKDGKHVGLAFTFRIPEEMQDNYLIKLELRGKQYGEPGDMICYIIDERNKDKWKNPVQAKKDGLIIAQSKPVKAQKSFSITEPAHSIEFSFYDKVTKTYPFIKSTDTPTHRTRYIGIIDIARSYVKNETDYSYSDTYGMWFVQGVKTTDLETNNLVYSYKELATTPSTANEKAFKPVDYVADMYYGFTFAKGRVWKLLPNPEGIYTAKFNTPKPVKASVARLTMRINREGMFKIDNGSISTANNNKPAIKTVGEIYSDDYGSYTDSDCFNYSKGRKVIFGLNPCDVTAVNGNILSLNSPVHLKTDDIVYPMNYEVTLAARNTEWDFTNKRKKIIKEKKLPMKLVYVKPDQFKDSERISDRLLFECDFRDKSDADNSMYNEFELQIYWETSARVQNSRNVGRIFDVTVSVDRTSALGEKLTPTAWGLSWDHAATANQATCDSAGYNIADTYLKKTDVAVAAKKLQNPVKIILDGAAKGQVSFDGSKDVKINTTVNQSDVLTCKDITKLYNNYNNVTAPGFYRIDNSAVTWSNAPNPGKVTYMQVISL